MGWLINRGVWNYPRFQQVTDDRWYTIPNRPPLLFSKGHCWMNAKSMEHQLNCWSMEDEWNIRRPISVDWFDNECSLFCPKMQTCQDKSTIFKVNIFLLIVKLWFSTLIYSTYVWSFEWENDHQQHHKMELDYPIFDNMKWIHLVLKDTPRPSVCAHKDWSLSFTGTDKQF